MMMTTTTTNRLTTGAALVAIAVAVALGGTAAAQTTQTNPEHAAHHPDGATTAQAAPPPSTPSAGAPGATPGASPMGGSMGGGQGMMGPGGGMMGMPDEGGRQRMMMMHHGAGSTPMNVIINVGPGIRVEAEEGDGRAGGRRGMGMAPPTGAGTMGPGMMGMMMGSPRGGAVGPDAMRHFERIDAHLAYVRAVLRVTDAQAPQWNAFADAARSAAERLRQAYAQAIQAAAQPTTAPAQLERRIALLSAQLDATRTMVAVAGPLYAALSDAQKRTADDLLAEHLRDMQRRGL